MHFIVKEILLESNEVHLLLLHTLSLLSLHGSQPAAGVHLFPQYRLEVPNTPLHF